ncbi:MAG TPA: hypothetical protein H9814_03830 [Candidatus Bacteroides merdigallinarum]|uniref:DUF4468 domain-containing protein n=1 Tax=Candidatus Bacteroides merdigallinarum TaxID=2838473 RepID=A0A9D2E8E5_9BACE|nr:hypothetical protein [Candidatus Bacteroides merdigallinarum]
MKKRLLIGCCIGLLWSYALPAAAQQIVYSNARALAEGRGDTVTTLRVERRTLNQLYLMGGADYRIESSANQSLSRYLRKRCYAVRIDTTLYVNCRKMRYKRYRLGGWYASAMEINGHIFYAAQPVGQAATETLTPDDAQKLPGEVGDAIQASSLVNQRVYYELNLETGRSYFVDKERMSELLAGQPELLKEFEKETSESAEVIGKYLRQLK